MNPFTRKPAAAVKRLEKQILDLQMKLDAAERTAQVLEAERDAMAEVIARNRMRVAAETAMAARSKAEAEGADGRDQQSTR